MSEPSSDAPDALVEALLVHGGLLRQVFDHMLAAEAAGHSAPDAASPAEVLCDITAGVLLPHFEQLPEADVRTALEVVSLAIAALEEEVFIVDPVPASPRPSARRRRRGRCGR